MKKHIVRQGECIASISAQHGFFWETLWNLPENSKVKEDHKTPTILKPGSEVFIPDKREKEEDCSTANRHRFRRKGTPAKLRLRIMRLVEPEDEPPEDDEPADVLPEEEPMEVDEEEELETEEVEEEPWADAPYVLEIDDQTLDGNTDSDGKIEVGIPPTARRARLTMEPGTERQKVYQIRLGHLDPSSSIPGVADRLNNLSYHDGSRPDEMTPSLREALRSFQRANNLEETGEIDSATVAKLDELHGS